MKLFLKGERCFKPSCAIEKRNFAPGQDYSAVSSYISARAAFAISTINGAGGNAAFAISGTNFITTTNNLVTLSGTNFFPDTTIAITGPGVTVSNINISSLSCIANLIIPTSFI